MATETEASDHLRRRPSPTTIVPNLSESSISHYDYEEQSCSPKNDGRSQPPTQTNGNGSNFTLQKIVSSTAFQKRLSRQSSLPWGHKPSPIIGASCFLFLLPIPLLLRACCPVSACMLFIVTISSYLSDHVFTGLESWSHALDRVLAPTALISCMYATYSTCGLAWVMLSMAAIKCHVWANYYSKNNMYDQFVIWHSLWHAVGVGLILFCFTYNGVVGKCWEGSEWEDMFMNAS